MTWSASLAGRLQLEVADATHVHPGAPGGPGDPEHHLTAAGAASHQARRVGVHHGLAYRLARAARSALAYRGGDVHREDLAEGPGEHVAVQVRSHAWPPEGPNRSVLITPGSCPALTSRLAAASTNPVGPQMNTAGAASRVQPGAASTTGLSRPTRTCAPGGALRVYTWLTSSPPPAWPRSAISPAYSTVSGLRTE